MPVELMLHPAGGGWRQLVGRERHDARAAGLRRELGLPDDRAVVMSGHQAEWWHAGIVAKVLAADAVARCLRAQGLPSACAWLVVDQDANEPWAVRFPVLTGAGRLAARTLELAPVNGSATRELTERFAADMPALAGTMPTLAEGERFASQAVEYGLGRIVTLMNKHREAPDAAAQVTAAAAEELRESEVHLMPVMATALARTTMFAEWVERMVREPDECINAYNAAVERHPQGRVARLRTGAGDWERAELPLWRRERDGRRRGVTVGEARTLDPTGLAPKALLMTALTRAAACDLFVHGTGGAVYDRITEDWMAAWMPGRPLAPAVMATATVRMEIEGAEVVTGEDVARRVWRRHHAAHEPALLGDVLFAGQKRDLVERIARAKSAGRAAEEYARLQDLLANYRQRHAAQLMQLEMDARDARERAADAEVLLDRTWAFPLLGRGTIAALQSAVRHAFE